MRRLRYLPALAVPAVAALALIYVLQPISRKATVGSDQCPLSASLVKNLSPLARGQIAAFSPSALPKPFPDVSFLGPEGDSEKVSSFRGKTVLLNLWATWCVPCRQEMPTLDALQRHLGGPNFNVVAVDVDTARLDRRKAFLKEAGIRSLAVYADPTGKILLELRASGPVVGLPTSFLIGPDGCRLGAILGPADWSSRDAEALISATIPSARPG